MKLDLKAEHTTYRAKDGTKLTGVTTYLGVLAKPALMGWYASEERNGVVAYTKAGRPLPVKKDGKPLWFAEAKRDKAADVGTVTHFRASAWLRQEPADTDGIPPDLWSASEAGFSRFKQWWEAQGLTLLHSERAMVYEFGLKFGGTADIIATTPRGETVVADLKTTKASPYWPYDETVAQAATYARMVEVLDSTTVARVCLVRIGKEPGDELQVYEVSMSEREEGWDLFRAAYRGYEAKKALARLRQ